MTGPRILHSKTRLQGTGAPEDQPNTDSRILILALPSSEGQLIARWVRRAKLAVRTCASLPELCEEVSRGCDCVLLAEEALSLSGSSTLDAILSNQPSWSDIPVLILASREPSSRHRRRRLAMLGPGGNVSLLERPLVAGTLVRSLVVAIRARNRQHETRKLIETMENLMRQQEAQTRLFDATLSSITDLAYTFDLDGNWIYANKPLLELWGKALTEITGKSSLELGYDPELAARLKRQVQEVVTTRKPVVGETFFTSAAGVQDYHEYIFSPVFAADGSVTAVTGTTRLTTERKRAEAIAESQRRVLQLVAEDRPLNQILDALANDLELGCSQKAYVSLQLLEADGVHLSLAAAPHLPTALTEVLNGLPLDPTSGAGAVAVLTMQPVCMEEIAVDHPPGRLRDLVLQQGFKGCWALPILSTHGKVLGAVTLFYLEPCRGKESDLIFGQMATRTASIAIQRKLSDAATRESQHRYSQLVHALPAAVYTTDERGSITLFNEPAALLWGRRPDLGKEQWCGSYRAHQPDGSPIPADQLPLAIALREGRTIRGEEILIERPDGTRRTVLSYADPIRDATGRSVGAVNMLLDITEGKRVEEVSRQLAAIVESSEDAIISKDLDGLITSWNRAAAQLFGYESHEMIGKPITLLMPEEHLGEEPNIMGRIRRGERIQHYETVRRRKNGSLVEISLTVSPIKDSHGKIIGASKILRDITKQKQSERKLEQAHQELVAASRAKDDFLAALSHELRTPLNPVLLLASEGAADPELLPQVRRRFQTIRDNAELEARLIDDLLDISRITHDKLSMNMESVEVQAALKEAITTVRADLDQKPIVLHTDFAEMPLLVSGDAVRLRQVFWNVIKNAVKFTPPHGSISITTRDDGAGRVTVVVSDTGIGMTEKELAQAFDAFSQGDHILSPGAHRFGGLGLGLAISRKLVGLHSGSITATSPGKGKGATFTISLPLAGEPAHSAHHSPESGSPFSSSDDKHALAKRILLVEDHEPTRIALGQLLRRRHYQVETASSLAEARELSARHSFELLISDLDLPDGSGVELMKELLERNVDLKGIALSGYGTESDLAETKAAGFSMHLTKPVRMQSLEMALARISPPQGDRISSIQK